MILQLYMELAMCDIIDMPRSQTTAQNNFSLLIENSCEWTK